MCMSVLSVHMYVHHMHTLSREVRGCIESHGLPYGCWDPLGTEPGFPVRAANVLIHRAISLAPIITNIIMII